MKPAPVLLFCALALAFAPLETWAADDTPNTKEWFGTGLGWADWTRLTGNWDGLRTAGERSGLSLTATNTTDWSDPWQGGLNNRTTARGLFNFTAALALPSGTTFTAQYLLLRGRDAADDLGALMNYSNIDAAPFAHWGELSVQQVLGDGRLRLKLGQLDANTEFDNVHAAAEFLNASAGYSPTIVGFPTYPDPAPSANVFVQATDQISAGFGVYAGTQPQRLDFSRPFLIGEIGVTTNPLGRIAAGVWRVNTTLPGLVGGTRPGTGGFYALAERSLWRKNPAAKDDPRGVQVFAQFGTASEAVSAIRRHTSVGLSATGLIPGRDQDVCGLLCSIATPTRDDPTHTPANEAVWEGYYGWHLTAFLTVKADLQFFRHPGGDASRRDAVVGTLRWVTTF